MRLLTDRADFFNDISEEIRLFLPSAELELTEASPDVDLDGTDGELISAMLSNDGTSFRAETRYFRDGAEFSYVYETPYRSETRLIEKRYAKRCIKVSVFRCLRQAYPQARLPWGSLTGIRPTRLWRELVSSEGRDGAERLMLSEFDVTAEKLRLAAEISDAQMPVL